MIDAVIVDWGTPELARRCWDSVDDFPSCFESLTLVDAKQRGLSYARAVNETLAEGHAPYVLALNADTRMLEPPDAILAIFEEHADVAVIGPRQIDDSGRITHAGIVGTVQQPEHRYWLTPLALCDQQTSEWTLDCVSVSGSVYFARRTVWEQLGGFLETPLFYEETWLSVLARHRGYRVVYTGATTWEHLWNRSPLPATERAGRAAESRALFIKACEREGIAV